MNAYSTPVFDQEKFKLMSENQALHKTIEVLEEQLVTAREADETQDQLQQENKLLQNKLRVLQGQYFSLEEQYSELQQKLESKRVSDLYSNRLQTGKSTVRTVHSPENDKPFNMASHLLSSPAPPVLIDKQMQTSDQKENEMINNLVARKDKLKRICKELQDRNRSLNTELETSKQQIQEAEKQIGS